MKLYDRKEVWDIEAWYLGQAVANLVLCYSPKKIILGGGVMHKEGLVDMVREAALRNLNGYICHKLLEQDDYIVLPGCGENSGILGAIELGKLGLV